MKEAVYEMSYYRSNVKANLTAWVVWGLAATFFFSDYLARVAPSVMHEHIQREFGLNELQIGVLNAAFYIPYILMQIPVGLSVDRLSIRNILTVMSLLTALGCVIFGLSDGLMTASFGRMLIGFSAAFAFVCALRLATSWFPPVMFGLLAGLTQALGMLGAAAGDAPVSFLVSHVGWRHTMIIIAFLFIILAAFLYQYIRDNPGQKRSVPKKVSDISILMSLKIVLSNRQTWINALYAGFLFGPTAVIGENLGPAFLQFGREFSAHSAAFATSLIFIGWGISGPLCGWVSDRLGLRKPLMIFSAICGIIFSFLIIFLPHMNLNTTMLLFFIFGATNTGVAISYAVATELHHPKVVGTSIAFTNMTSIFVGASLQPIVGQFLHFIGGERSFNVSALDLSDFQSAFIILPICSTVALILAFFVKETYCSPVYDQEQEK
ncbi:MFS transporter [Legionella sp. W05-934-2]|jgi:sugar phosphate permease|uniref:MFS transporter n=1 Tax=Legionella sp. W05-934-2 TaxID=1198649 RepID=UPI003461DBA5